MTRYVSSNTLNELIEAGIIPKGCTKWELIAAPNKPVLVHSEVLVTEEQMRVIIDTLVLNREELLAEFFVNSQERRESGMEPYGPIPSAYLPK